MGQLDEDRVRQAVRLLIEKKPRGYLGILQELQRLVRVGCGKPHAHAWKARWC